MKNALITLALLALACSFVACADEEPEPAPGTLTVHWAFKGAGNCGSRAIENLHIWMGHPSDESPIQSVTVPCDAAANSGDHLFEDVAPGSYDIGVDGILADKHAAYEAIGTATVGDGEDAIADVIELDERKSSLHVEWKVWDDCHKLETGPEADMVSVKIYLSTNLNSSAAEATGKCSASFLDPADPEVTSYGLLFQELDPQDVHVVVELLLVDVGTLESVTDGAGEPAELEENTNDILIKLDPGQHHKVIVKFVE